MVQLVKNLPAMWETWVRSLGREDALEKEMATHSSILAWRILWTEEPDELSWSPLSGLKGVQPPLPFGETCGSAGKESACNVGDLGSIPGLGRSPGEGKSYPLQYSWASLIVQLVKNLPAMWETWVQSLGRETIYHRSGRAHV